MAGTGRRENLSDGELVEAARAGDKAAFTILISRHRPMVLALVERLLKDSTLGADIVQEATVAALVGLERLRSPERFGAWYAGIGLNVARTVLRQVGPERPLVHDYVERGPGPEEAVEANELARRVRQAIEALAPGQRAAVLAFYWQGLTHAEAALELGISLGAVKARLHQARAALAPQLTPSIVWDEEVRPVTSTAATNWVEVEVVEVRRSGEDDLTRQAHAAILQERSGVRRFPIYIGIPEARALACNLEAVEMPRPMTYQLAASLVGASGSTVTEARITRLAESTFYAVIVVEGPGGQVEVDARPSDAMNLALVCGAPIRVDAAILDDPEAIRFRAWEEFPTGTPELAAEVLKRQSDLQARLAERGGTPQ